MKPIHHLHFESLVSTNTYISESCREMDLPLLVTSGFQTGGRGQGKNIWISEKGKNMILSLALEIKNLDASRNFCISRISALAMHELLNSYVENVKIKWPNDLIVNHSKIAGLLIENTISGGKVIRTIIGAGLNVNQTRFPETDIPAISLGLILKKELELSPLVEGFCNSVLKFSEMLDRQEYEEIDDLYFSKLLNYDKWAEYESGGKKFTAKLLDVMDDGHLILENENGEYVKYGFGEINQLSL